jgi:hypothetical protein
MISPAELAAMQAVAASAMDVSIQIQRATNARTAMGGTSESYANHGAPVKGNLAQPTAGQLQNYDFLIGALATWQVRLPAGTDVLVNDLLIVAGVPAMRVQVVLDPQSYQTARRVLATEIK